MRTTLLLLVMWMTYLSSSAEDKAPQIECGNRHKKGLMALAKFAKCTIGGTFELFDGDKIGIRASSDAPIEDEKKIIFHHKNEGNSELNKQISTAYDEGKQIVLLRKGWWGMGSYKPKKTWSNSDTSEVEPPAEAHYGYEDVYDDEYAYMYDGHADGQDYDEQYDEMLFTSYMKGYYAGLDAQKRKMRLSKNY